MAEATEAVEPENESFQFFINRAWSSKLLYDRHVNYCRHILLKLPDIFEEYDTQRMTFLHFSITSLDLLKSIEKIKPTDNDRIINWIYYLQVKSECGEMSGFLGSSTFLILGESESREILPNGELFSSHVTMTYAALVSLLTLGDDLQKIDRRKTLKGVSALQNKDGSFRATRGYSAESDMRFVYSAVCICYILNDFSHINTKNLVVYIKNSFTYEGCFGSGAGAEGHAAYTFCAVASLFLLGELEETLKPDELMCLKRWCLFRQECGFTGRPNKSEDTCYSYWVGATLELLNTLGYSNKKNNVEYLLGNQNPLSGGIGKCDSDYPDPLHTFMGLAALSLVDYEGLNKINPALTMSENAVKRLQSLQQTWETL